MALAQAAKSFVEPGIGREDFEELAGGEALHGLRRLDDRHRAGQPLGVDDLRDLLGGHRSLPFGGRLRPRVCGSDEEDVAVAGVQVEGGHALDAVDEWIQVLFLDLEDVHREGARLDVDLAELLRHAKGRVPGLLPGLGGLGDQGRAALAGLGRKAQARWMRSLRKASRPQYWRKMFTFLPSAAAPLAMTAAACRRSSVPEKSTMLRGSSSTRSP